MDLLTTTPFGQRPMTAAMIARAATARRPASIPKTDKWELFRAICIGRHAFGVSDRDLAVLNALLSFHRGAILDDDGPLIVFPSNRALSERAHGMAESTLRRHLAALTRAGLVERHDSPNGKRYAARGAGGEVLRAFGFDLRPLLVRAEEITRAAQDAREAEVRLRALRERAVLLLRDARKYVAFGRETGLRGPWDRLDSELTLAARLLRRKPDMGLYERVYADLETLFDEAQSVVTPTRAEKMSGKDLGNERHHHNSNTDSPEFEPCHEVAQGGHVSPSTTRWRKPSDNAEGASRAPVASPTLPLRLVLMACADILDYAPHGIHHWHELVATASDVRGMMGISPSAWDEACHHMGADTAAIAVAAILQRFSTINSPGGYLRALTAKAADGTFSPGPMIMALLSDREKTAA